MVVFLSISPITLALQAFSQRFSFVRDLYIHILLLHFIYCHLFYMIPKPCTSPEEDLQKSLTCLCIYRHFEILNCLAPHRTAMLHTTQPRPQLQNQWLEAWVCLPQWSWSGNLIKLCIYSHWWAKHYQGGSVKTPGCEELALRDTMCGMWFCDLNFW